MTEDSPNADRYMVLLEQIQGHVQIIAEEQVQLRTDMNWGFKSLRDELRADIAVANLAIEKNSQKIGSNSTKLDRLDARVEQNGIRLDKLDAKVEQNSTRLDKLTVKVDQNSKQLNKIDSKMDRIVDKVEIHDKQLSRFPTRH